MSNPKILWLSMIMVTIIFSACGSNFDKSKYKETIKDIDGQFKKGEYSEVITIIDNMGADYDNDKTISWYKTESIKRQKELRVKTKKEIKEYTNLGGFIALGIAILFGIGLTPKQDKRFKTGYKNNEDPDYSVVAVILVISAAIFGIGYLAYFLYGLFLGV